MVIERKVAQMEHNTSLFPTEIKLLDIDFCSKPDLVLYTAKLDNDLTINTLRVE